MSTKPLWTEQPDWPELDFGKWSGTCRTLHLWSQVVGKIRLSKSPWVNHSWGSALYVTERGLTTSVIHDRRLSFSIEFDFISHELRISRSDGNMSRLSLIAEPVSSFYKRCLRSLDECGIDTAISETPNEVVDAIPFSRDRLHREYDPVYANRFWRILLRCDRLMKQFRSKYIGKVSPVHFFWGSFDLAVTRFSGRRAPEHPGGVPHLPDLVAREAYSHEVSSCGFWPGNERFPEAAFYSYAYPQPEGFDQARVSEGAYFHEKLREFILPYRVVRESTSAGSGDERVLDFFQKTYEAAASLGAWDRDLLENDPYLAEIQKARSAS